MWMIWQPVLFWHFRLKMTLGYFLESILRKEKVIIYLYGGC